jgi:hypothetical protein
MRIRLRTLLIVVAIGPPLLAGAWGIWVTFGVMRVMAVTMTCIGFLTVITLLMKDRF